MVLTDRATEPADALPIELSGLERWATGQRILEARLAGMAVETCRAAELARGDLPPGLLGEAAIDRLLPLVEGLVARVAQHGPGLGPATSLDIAIELDDSEAVIGTVAGVIGDMARSVTFSRVGARHRLAAWARLLVLTAAQPSVAYTSVTIGRGAGRAVRVAIAGPLSGGTEERHRTALDLLGALVELHRLGMAEPLPLFCDTSAAYAQAVHERKNPTAAARREWETRPGSWDREDRDPEHLLVLGGAVDLDEVLAAVPRPEEAGPGWANGEQSRFGRYARRLWDGLLAHEQVRES
jgi:exodeoxyribonuclease V gamma subunit